MAGVLHKSGDTVYPDGYPGTIDHEPDPDKKPTNQDSPPLRPKEGSWPHEHIPNPDAVAAEAEYDARLAKGEKIPRDEMRELLRRMDHPGTLKHRPGIRIPYVGEPDLTDEEKQIILDMGDEALIVEKPLTVDLPVNAKKFYKAAGLEENDASKALLGQFCQTDAKQNYANFKAFVEAQAEAAK